MRPQTILLSEAAFMCDPFKLAPPTTLYAGLVCCPVHNRRSNVPDDSSSPSYPGSTRVKDRKMIGTGQNPKLALQ